MIAILKRWIPAYALVCSLVTLTSACTTMPPIPTDELSVQLERHNLVLTPDGEGPHPVVVLLHACLGNLGHVDEWAERLQSRGYVTVVVNSTKARGIEGHFDYMAVCGGRVLRPADRARDIRISIERLLRSENVDQNRIGIVGFSHGGWTALDFLGQQPGTNSIGTTADYRESVLSVVAVYPYCGGEIESGLERWPRDIHVLMLLAGTDWVVGTAKCEALAREQRSRGYSVSVHTYIGARHGYDVDPALLDGYDERYHETAAQDTEKRIIDFLDKTLASRTVRLRDHKILNRTSHARTKGLLLRNTEPLTSR